MSQPLVSRYVIKHGIQHRGLFLATRIAWDIGNKIRELDPMGISFGMTISPFIWLKEDLLAKDRFAEVVEIPCEQILTEDSTFLPVVSAKLIETYVLSNKPARAESTLFKLFSGRRDTVLLRMEAVCYDAARNVSARALQFPQVKLNLIYDSLQIGLLDIGREYRKLIESIDQIKSTYNLEGKELSVEEILLLMKLFLFRGADDETLSQRIEKSTLTYFAQTNEWVGNPYILGLLHYGKVSKGKKFLRNLFSEFPKRRNELIERLVQFDANTVNISAYDSQHGFHTKELAAILKALRIWNGDIENTLRFRLAIVPLRGIYFLDLEKCIREMEPLLSLIEQQTNEDAAFFLQRLEWLYDKTKQYERAIAIGDMRSSYQSTALPYSGVRKIRYLRELGRSSEAEELFKRLEGEVPYFSFLYAERIKWLAENNRKDEAEELIRAKFKNRERLYQKWLSEKVHLDETLLKKQESLSLRLVH